MSKPKAENVNGVGRASFTPLEIAERNNISETTVYTAIRRGRLKVSNLGEGGKGAIRITPEQEHDWHLLCAKEKQAQHA